MNRLLRFLGREVRLEGLEDILAQVAQGQLAPSEAAERIRRLAAKPRIPPEIGRVLRFIGALSVIIGLAIGAYSVWFVVGAEQAQGTVIEMAGQAPIVEYQVKGRHLKVEARVKSSPSPYSVGEKVPVLYRPGDPSYAQINTFTERWLFPLSFSGHGIALIVASIFLPRFLEWLCRPSGKP
jgi:hypothetical protein